MSTHLVVLTRAGLATSQRHSRSIIYRANIAALRTLMLFPAKDCCGGGEEMCGPLVEVPVLILLVNAAFWFGRRWFPSTLHAEA